MEGKFGKKTDENEWEFRAFFDKIIQLPFMMPLGQYELGSYVKGLLEDIDYIVRDKMGIFVSKRDIDSFSKTTKYVMDNYVEIQKNMKKNILPTKNSMIKQISDIIKFQNS